MLENQEEVKILTCVSSILEYKNICAIKTIKCSLFTLSELASVLFTVRDVFNIGQPAKIAVYYVKYPAVETHSVGELVVNWVKATSYTVHFSSWPDY